MINCIDKCPFLAFENKCVRPQGECGDEYKEYLKSKSEYLGKLWEDATLLAYLTGDEFKKANKKFMEEMIKLSQKEI